MKAWQYDEHAAGQNVDIGAVRHQDGGPPDPTAQLVPKSVITRCTWLPSGFLSSRKLLGLMSP